MRCFWIMITLSIFFYECFGSKLGSEPPLERNKIINAVNKANTTWRAVSAASVFSDRLCIASKGKFNSFLSAQELLTCCTQCGNGCEGGFENRAWKYFITNGIVTGGDYNSKMGCQPYTFEPCEHRKNHPGPRKNCSSLEPMLTPECKQKCYNKEYKGPTFIKDHHKVKTTFSISGDVIKIQKEIMKNGPVQAGFVVFEDFFSYKKGVYHYVTGDLAGGHAVKILGWGVDHGTPYWLVANSWNTDWGLDGLFKIKRGNDECGIETLISGGTPFLNK